MSKKIFQLDEDDKFVIGVAIDFVMNYLKNKACEPREIIGLGNALFALERLPQPTKGVFCELGVSIRGGSDGFSEMKYFDFIISSESFSISRGGSVYDPEVGSDSYSLTGWYVGMGEYRESVPWPHELEDYLGSLISFGATFHITDESQIDYDNPDPEDEEEDCEDITAEEAVEIARQILPKYEDGAEITGPAREAKDMVLNIYSTNRNCKIEDCWCLIIDIPSHRYMLISTEVVLVSKITGEIVYYGSASDEG